MNYNSNLHRKYRNILLFLNISTQIIKKKWYQADSAAADTYYTIICKKTKYSRKFFREKKLIKKKTNIYICKLNFKNRKKQNFNYFNNAISNFFFFILSVYYCCWCWRQRRRRLLFSGIYIYVFVICLRVCVVADTLELFLWFFSFFFILKFVSFIRRYCSSRLLCRFFYGFHLIISEFLYNIKEDKKKIISLTN